jgi:hypothetical protein
VPSAMGQLVNRLGHALPPAVNGRLQNVEYMQQVVADAISFLRHRRHASPVSQGQPSPDAPGSTNAGDGIGIHSHPLTFCSE